MEQSEFIDWLLKSKYGDKVTYFDGYLSFSRGGIADFKKLSPVQARVAALADYVMSRCDDGYVVLTQRRLDRGRWEYIATRTAKGIDPNLSPERQWWSEATKRQRLDRIRQALAVGTSVRDLVEQLGLSERRVKDWIRRTRELR